MVTSIAENQQEIVPLKLSSKPKKTSIEEKVRIIEENIRFLLKREPVENEEILKKIYTKASGIVVLSHTMKRAREEGIIDQSDYNFNKNSDTIKYNSKISLAIATVVKRVTPRKLFDDTNDNLIVTNKTQNENKSEEEIEGNSKFDSKIAIEVREKTGLYQRQLGERLGTTQGIISKFELGRFREITPLVRKYLDFLKTNGYNPFNL